MYKFGKLTSLRREEISTKQRERVQKYGEVFTPSNIVKDMLDLLPTKDDGRTLILNEKTKAEKSYISSTFLEPSCGDGNFLVEILNRKLKCVSESSFDHDVLLALSSIYGVDIQADNVLESRRRMLGVVEDFYGSRPISEEQLEKINEILFRNIILADFLNFVMIKMDNNGHLLSYTEEKDLGIPLVTEKGSMNLDLIFYGDFSTWTAKAGLENNIRNCCNTNGVQLSYSDLQDLVDIISKDCNKRKAVCANYTIQADCSMSYTMEYLEE